MLIWGDVRDNHESRMLPGFFKTMLGDIHISQRIWERLKTMPIEYKL